MSTDLLDDLVIANHILSHHGVVDVFGHVSVRHPERPDRYVMSCSRSPGRVTREDLIEFQLDNAPIDQKGRAMYAERAIHGSIYRARPEVNAVCHNHAPAIIPFGITAKKLRPVFHVGSVVGNDVPVWDIAQKFGDTNLLVVTQDQGDDLAATLGDRRVVLMRGHGSAVVGRTLRECVFSSVYMQRNAELQTIADRFGEVHFLSPNEVDIASSFLFQPLSQDRAWDAWAAEAG